MGLEHLRRTALERLLARRRKLADAYDALISDPASFGVTGAVSVTNRKLDELRAEMDALDRRIATIAGGGGITRCYPDYRWGRDWPLGAGAPSALPSAGQEAEP